MFLSTKERASKSLRRLTKTKISQPIGQTTSLELPKKIIKALCDYKAQGPHEISFQKGDFFHVIGRENDTEWFEASNPATNVRGIVPVSYFQVIDKTEKNNMATLNRPPSSSTASTLTSELESGFSDLSINGHSKKKHPIYGVVMYDFKAERPDELDAQAGEAIVVIAQSNHEWYVAKPISRLGGPGLIPISFVQVRDVLTGELVDPLQQQQPNDLPNVDKQTSLGTAGTVPNWTQEVNRQSNSSADTVTDIVDFVSIDSFILEGDQYWFVIYAHVNTNMHRILYRLYEDFYDFQVTLLKSFPAEAGKSDKERILPFMPGPLKTVDEKVTAERQIDLDRYCKDLLKLPKYISESGLVQRQLFGIHEGDIELDYDPRIEEEPVTPTPQSTTPQPAQQQQVKIKIVYKDDMFAIKVPVDCSLYYLKSKVFERIQSDVKLEYKNELTKKDEPLETESDMEEAFVQAIQKGKLTVVAVV